MATIAQPIAPSSRPLLGVVCIQTGMLFFVCQDALMKSLIGEFTIWMLIVARALIAACVLIPAIAILGPPHRLLTPLWPLHLLRATLFAVGFSLYYAAFPLMGLAEVTTIFFAAPIFIALFAALFLRERIGAHRLAALAVGFLGVAIAMNPTGATFRWVSILPLICAVTYAISQVVTRRIGERESTMTLSLYTLVFAGLLIAPLSYGLNALIALDDAFAHLRWRWFAPDGRQLGVLALLGFVGMIGISLIWRAYQVAPASVIAPFDYTYLPWAVLMGYAIWNETPPPNTLVGMALIVGAGLYIGFRELRQARRAVEPAPTAENVVTPAAPVGGPIQLAARRRRRERWATPES